MTKCLHGYFKIYYILLQRACNLGKRWSVCRFYICNSSSIRYIYHIWSYLHIVPNKHEHTIISKYQVLKQNKIKVQHMKISEEGNEYVFVDHAALLFGAKKCVLFFYYCVDQDAIATNWWNSFKKNFVLFNSILVINGVN